LYLRGIWSVANWNLMQAAANTFFFVVTYTSHVCIHACLHTYMHVSNSYKSDQTLAANSSRYVYLLCM